MRARILTILPVLLFGFTGCHRSAESERQAQVEAFNKRMQELEASVSVGMARSNVLTILGHPNVTSTNSGPYYNWTIDDFVFEKPGPVKSAGVTVVYSNNVVISKRPIL